jgi:hypothetical protein
MLRPEQIAVHKYMTKEELQRRIRTLDEPYVGGMIVGNSLVKRLLHTPQQSCRGVTIELNFCSNQIEGVEL